MEEIVVWDWDEVDFDEQYELINEQTKYHVFPEKHRLDWADEDDSVIDIVDRKSGEIIGSVKVIERVKAELDIVVCRYCGREVRGDGFISANQLAGEAGWELEGDNLWTCPDCLQDRGERGGGDEPRNKKTDRR